MSGRNKQTKDLLIEIKAKAFELQAVLSDYLERERNDDGYGRLWFQLAEAIHRGAEKKIKGA